LERTEKQRSRLYIRGFDWRDYGHYQCVANIEGVSGKQSNKVAVAVLFTADNVVGYEPSVPSEFPQL
jgi:hypothetical protein